MMFPSGSCSRPWLTPAESYSEIVTSCLVASDPVSRTEYRVLLSLLPSFSWVNWSVTTPCIEGQVCCWRPAQPHHPHSLPHSGPDPPGHQHTWHHRDRDGLQPDLISIIMYFSGLSLLEAWLSVVRQFNYKWLGLSIIKNILSLPLLQITADLDTWRGIIVRKW